MRKTLLLACVLACIGVSAHAQTLFPNEQDDLVYHGPEPLVLNQDGTVVQPKLTQKPWPSLKNCPQIVNNLAQIHLHGGGKLILEVSPSGECSATFEPNIQESK